MNTKRATFGVVRHCEMCGWIRVADSDPKWLASKIWHGVYGWITESRLVQLDILNHDCDLFMSIVSRLQEAEKGRYTFNDAA